MVYCSSFCSILYNSKGLISTSDKSISFKSLTSQETGPITISLKQLLTDDPPHDPPPPLESK